MPFLAQGDAILFWTHDTDQSWNADSLHAGMPVKKGEKIVLTKWIRENLHAPRIPVEYLELTLPIL